VETLLNRDPVVIVGGGLSGLAAAVRLSASGIPVLLLEQRPVLGGRASSFTDSTTGDVVDNGQHLLIAGYERTLAFVETIGSRHLLRVQMHPLLTFFHPQRGFVEFRLTELPSPWHLVKGILSSSLFTSRERYDVLRAGMDIIRSKDAVGGPGAGKSIAQWLDMRHQAGSTRAVFWIPLAASIMNERTDTASAELFLHRCCVSGGLISCGTCFRRVSVESLRNLPRAVSGTGGRPRSADVRELVTEERPSESHRDGATGACRSIILAVPRNRAVELYPLFARPAELETNSHRVSRCLSSLVHGSVHGS
jgi:zeta-carotene desaturase